MIESRHAAPTGPRGLICPLATPLDDRGRLDADVLGEHIDALVPDVDGLFVLGSSGEHPWLTADDGAEVARVASERAAGRVPLLLGVGEASTRRVLARMELVRDVPADFLVVTPPTYFPVGDDAMVAYFTEIADAAARPVVLYNMPQATGSTVSPAVVEAVAGHPNIAGIKDSGGDPFAFQEMLRCRGAGFSVLQGREQLMAASLLLGADGVVSSMANFAPRLLRAVERAVAAGDAHEVRRAQASVTRLAALFAEGHWLVALKAALEACGFAVGPPSAPLPAATAAQRGRIAALLEEADGWVTTARTRAGAG
jgi:4-hydroxy-tetrahydrodipicolinate synthase